MPSFQLFFVLQYRFKTVSSGFNIKFNSILLNSLNFLKSSANVEPQHSFLAKSTRRKYTDKFNNESLPES